jgi:flagellar hook-length control protein FliK
LFQQNEQQGQSLMQDSNQFMKQGMAEGKEAAKSKLTTKSAEFKSAMTGMEGLQAPPIKGESLKFDPLAPMAPVPSQGPVNQTENEAAVKQLMNQAQYLIKKGGGEVNVQMTPEGMGTIHLKVMLQDGKVNLQMSADNQEAKKTIESSLVDLKNSLAAHKLSVENVKVETVNAAANDTAAQNQTNMNGQGQRDQTRQFWNQFNENFGNQGRREALTDFQATKGYGMKRRDPLQPIDSAGVKSSARAVEGKGSGLNLVA